MGKIQDDSKIFYELTNTWRFLKIKKSIYFFSNLQPLNKTLTKFNVINSFMQKQSKNNFAMKFLL